MITPMWKLLFFSFLSTSAWGQSVYKTNTQTCYGFPRVSSLKTNSDTCVGLVADKSNVPWSFPRKILFHEGSFYVTAFGGWKENEGQLWKLNVAGSGNKKIQIRQIYKSTDRTHGIRLGPDGKIYFGDAKKIFRFDPSRPDKKETVVATLPDSFTMADGRTFPSNHPLSEFIFLGNGDMVVNVGAPSNDCSEEFQKFKACTQRDQQAELRLFRYNSNNRSFDGQYSVLARGLRNSMGLLSNAKTHELYQAENAADAIGTPDELNVIDLTAVQAGKKYDFGWPFCKGMGERYGLYPNFKTFCAEKSDRPLLLFPAHAAPLDMKYYEGKMFPEYKNKILVSYHGHRPSGSRIAILSTNQNFRPKNEIAMLINGWDADPRGFHPKGRPVGITEDQNGAIYILDDQNQSLLVVAKTHEASRDNGRGKSLRMTESDLTNVFTNVQLKEWDELFPMVISAKKCSECHGDVVGGSSRATLVNMVNQGWIARGATGGAETGGAERHLIWKRMNGMDGLRIMPPPPESTILEDKSRQNGFFERLESLLSSMAGTSL